MVTNVFARLAIQDLTVSISLDGTWYRDLKVSVPRWTSFAKMGDSVFKKTQTRSFAIACPDSLAQFANTLMHVRIIHAKMEAVALPYFTRLLTMSVCARFNSMDTTVNTQ